MCAATRIARALVAGSALAAAAHAQVPEITPAPAAPVAVAPAPSPAVAPPATAAPTAAPFTPAPAAPFTVATPPVAPRVVATPAPEPRDAHAGDMRWHDAHVDRVVVLPTAETHPAGTWAFSDYELVVLQATYGLTDRTQLALTTTPVGLFGGEGRRVLAKDPIVPLDLSLKSTLFRGDRVRLAALVSATGIAGFEQGAAFLSRFGGVAQLCFDRACRSSASMGGTLLLVGPAVLLADAAGFVIRTSDHIALLLEAQTLIPLGREAGEANALGVAGGVRFSGRALALDIALETLNTGGRIKVPVLPFIAGTWRLLP